MSNSNIDNCTIHLFLVEYSFSKILNCFAAKVLNYGGCSPCWKRTLKVRGKERLNKSLHFTCRSKTYLVLTEQWYGTCKPAWADIGKVLEPLKPMIFLHLFDGLFSAFIETLSLQRRVLLFILMKKPYRLSNDPGLQSYHYSSAVTAK